MTTSAVTLEVDEIHIKSFFGYKGITGVDDNLTEATSTALIVMVQSITCKFEDVAHIVPHVEPLHGSRGLLAKVAEGRHMGAIDYRLENGLS